MLDRVVRYLHSHGVAFHLSSHPSPEPLPEVAHRLPPGGLMLQTHLVLVGDRPAIACTARGAKLSLPRLKLERGVDASEGGTADRPPPYTGADAPIPPLWGELGVLTIVDEAVTLASSLGFTAFCTTDLVALPYDEFSRF